MRILNFFRKIIISTADWFYKPFSGFISQITFRYASTGGINTVLDIFLYFVFYNYVFQKQNFDLYFITLSPHIAAFVFVFPITFSIGFLMAKYITFIQSELRGRKQLFRYGLTVVGAILLNYIFLKFFVEYCNYWATFSKILTTVLVVAYSYFMQRYFSFKIITNEEQT